MSLILALTMAATAWTQVHNAPGEDICVIMCGYEEPIRKMLLEQNPGAMPRLHAYLSIPTVKLILSTPK